MFAELIANKTRVRLYYCREIGYIDTVITAFYEDFNVIRISDHNLVIPLELICRIQILDESDTESTLS